MLETRHRILVVDDEPGIVRCLERLFTRRGHEVQGVTDPRAALDRVATFQPDVIVADQRMPDVSGTEVLSEAMKRFPHVACMLISGFADFRDDPILSERIVYVSKPFSSAELFEWLRVAVDRARDAEP